MGFMDFFKPKGEDSIQRVRKDRVEKLADTVILADIAMNNKKWKIRAAALNNPNFVDQTLLANIAKNEKDDRVRATAILKLIDQALLAEFAKNDKSWRGRFCALVNLNDQALLANIAKYDINELVRIAAKKRLTALAHLADVAIKINMNKSLNVIIFRQGQNQPDQPERYFREIVNQKFGPNQSIEAWRIAGIQDALTVAQVKMMYPAGISHGSWPDFGQPVDEWEGQGPDERAVVALFFEA